MRSIKKIHNAQYNPIADLITYTPFPSAELPQLDPFLLLNHHGQQLYGSNNQGLPFGPHPHRGMETVTFILEGDIMHHDSGGHQSVIESGGIQYMRAGRGLIHAETSSDKFKNEGGPLDILQLWLNMPAAHKMDDPQYKGLQKEDIKNVELPGSNAKFMLVFGNLLGQQGSLEHNLLDIFLGWLEIGPNGIFKLQVPASHTILCYVIKGELKVQGQQLTARQLVEFEYQNGDIKLEALQESVVLFGHAKPLREPLVAQGPFVMNTEEEIRQAYRDYQQGKFGNW